MAEALLLVLPLLDEVDADEELVDELVELLALDEDDEPALLDEAELLVLELELLLELEEELLPQAASRVEKTPAAITAPLACLARTKR